jgi:Helix-turn-helix domain
MILSAPDWQLRQLAKWRKCLIYPDALGVYVSVAFNSRGDTSMSIEDLQPPRRRLHTIKDVCAEARTSPATAWRLIAAGTLQTIRIGRRRLVTDESLRRLITEGAPTPDQAA